MSNNIGFITICEVSTRDGFQSLPFNILTEDKLVLLEKMVDAGIREIEVGSIAPDTNIDDGQMADTPEVFRRLKKREGVVYRALLQTVAGMRLAIECGCRKIKLNASASDEHYRLMTGKSLKEGVQGFADIGKLAQDAGIKVLGSISLAFESPFDKEIPMSNLRILIDAYLAAGATEISLNDTAGMATPRLVGYRFSQLAKEYPQVEAWAFHPHNTYGMGLANTLSAIENGATKIDASLAGVGGCPVFKKASGNISTEDLHYMLSGMGIETGIDAEKLMEAGNMVERLILDQNWDSYLRRIDKWKSEGIKA